MDVSPHAAPAEHCRPSSDLQLLQTYQRDRPIITKEAQIVRWENIYIYVFTTLI